MNEVISVLEQIKPGFDYLNEKNLIYDEILTSFEIISLIPILNEKFSVNIGVNDLIPENFESAEAIYNLIKNK